LLLTGCADMTARFWDAQSGRPVLTALPHQGDVGAVAFSRDGQMVATAAARQADGRGEVWLWDVATGRPLGPPLDHPKAASSVAFAPDGLTLLTGCVDGVARLWPLPAPVSETPERGKLRLQVLTGLELDENGGVRALDAAAWRQRRDRLASGE
jgi:WD40 repeat protein